jgi:hypothetical protein
MAEKDTVQSPPSSLDLDRTSSAARSGRERMGKAERGDLALVAGDVDGDSASASAVGDGAPGGDNPTPDQNVAEEIGRAVGLEYQDSEELRGADKVVERDKHRWELDPASSEDFKER